MEVDVAHSCLSKSSVPSSGRPVPLTRAHRRHHAWTSSNFAFLPLLLTTTFVGGIVAIFRRKCAGTDEGESSASVPDKRIRYVQPESLRFAVTADQRFSTDLQDKISVLVGDGEAFTVHRDFICRHSPFFSAACWAGAWREAPENAVRLPEHEPAVFKDYVL